MLGLRPRRCDARFKGKCYSYAWECNLGEYIRQAASFSKRRQPFRLLTLSEWPKEAKSERSGPSSRLHKLSLPRVRYLHFCSFRC
jgi:hypothetical protein